MRKDETEASAWRGSGTARLAGVLAGLFLALLAFTGQALAQTHLKVFAANFPKIDVLRALANAYSQARPGLTIEIETGGATLESQQQALNALLGARDAGVDLVMVDVLRIPQWALGQWLEPLDGLFGPEREALLARLFPAYRQAALAGGRLMAVPYSADAQAMLVRGDLLEKHGLAVPTTQAALREAATRILAAENQPTLRAIDLSSAPVESSVCTAAMALWGTGHDLVTEGKPALLTDPARRALQGLQALKDAKLLPVPPGEGHPERIRLAMQAGSLVFGHGWSYAWQRMQTDIDSVVAGKVRLVPVPGETEDRASSCAGGWMVGVTAFSGRKVEALAFLRYLASPEAARLQAELGDLPAQTGPYQDATIVAARPFLGQMGAVLAVARLRPQSARYSEVSDIVRTNLSAFMAGSKTAEAALQDMQARLSLIFR
ncbi:MAG: extracellular solute-binding protein [Beijerinckiaceae bacterium]|nr:extracellular solute-binding protein [Beijerinckiaceae bacterium]